MPAPRYAPYEVDPAELRHRVQIQVDQGSAVDSFNAHVPSWGTVATRHAKIDSPGGREVWYGVQVVADSTLLVEMRWYSGLTAAMRLIYQGRAFTILSVTDVQERRRKLLIQCKEQV